jgi:NitT/TauT family transport system permease protein
MSRAGRKRRPRLPARVVDVAAPLGLMLLIIAAWEAAVWAFDVAVYVLPAPSRIVREIFVQHEIILGHLEVTLIEILSGYALAALVGFVLSILIVYSKPFRRGVLPLIVASQTIPVIAIAPILVIWFGYNVAPRIIITALVAFFPLTVAFVTGLERLEREFIDFFRSLNASGVQIFLKLRLPAALPNIFAGLKVATTLAVIGATISEWVGASAGLGYLMAQDTQQLNTTRVFAALVVLGIVGMLFFALVGLIEKLSMPWIHGRLLRRWLPARAAAAARPADPPERARSPI